MTKMKNIKRVLRRMMFHMAKKQRAKWSAELMKELSGSFKYEPHPAFKDQPN